MKIVGAFLYVLFPAITLAQGVGFYQLQLTTNPVDHQWPAINSNGTVVWSQKDANGYYQVWQQDSVPNAPQQQMTSGNQNHERPVIDDNGDNSLLGRPSRGRSGIRSDPAK